MASICQTEKKTKNINKKMRKNQKKWLCTSKKILKMQLCKFNQTRCKIETLNSFVIKMSKKIYLQQELLLIKFVHSVIELMHHWSDLFAGLMKIEILKIWVVSHYFFIEIVLRSTNSQSSARQRKLGST